MNTINHIVAVVMATANSPAIDWSALLTADQLKTLHAESQVVLRFRAGRPGACQLRPVAAESGRAIEVERDPVGDERAIEVGPFFWRSTPAFLFAAAPTAVVIEVLRVSR